MMILIAESTGTTLKETSTTITGEVLEGGLDEPTGVKSETRQSTNTVQFVTAETARKPTGFSRGRKRVNVI
jgi:hypothetical protein